MNMQEGGQMKCDLTAVSIVTGAFIPIAGGLFWLRRRALQFFAMHLAFLSVLDLLLVWVGVGERLWWLIHFPSDILLGFDEILERHGLLVSTIAHVGDLVFWAGLFTLPIAIRIACQTNANQHTQASPGACSSRTGTPDAPPHE